MKSSVKNGEWETNGDAGRRNETGRLQKSSDDTHTEGACNSFHFLVFEFSGTRFVSAFDLGPEVQICDDVRKLTV